MASRILLQSAIRTAPIGLVTRGSAAAQRGFHATARVLADSPLPARKPVGAFRGGLFGFLLGSTLSGAGVYSYVVSEYKTSNELLTEDIYALQNACQRLSSYIQTLEEKFDAAERKRK